MANEHPPEPHRCRRGRRCARRGDDRQPAIVDLPGFCDRDRQQLVAALRNLPKLHDQLGALDLLEPARSGMGGSERSSGAAAPLPLQLDSLTLADLIHDELTRWEDVVRDRTGMPPSDGAPRSRLMPDRRVQPKHAAVLRAAELLSRCVPVLLSVVPSDMVRWSSGTTRAGERLVQTREDGYDGAAALIDLYNAAERIVGTTTVVQHLKGRDCPGCAAPTLQLISADGKVRCTTCRDQWEEHEYDFLARVLRGEEKAPRAHHRRVWSSDAVPDQQQDAAS